MKAPNLKRFFRQNGSTILTCIGAVGVIATAVSAAKCTPKAMDILYDCEKENEDKLHTALRVAPAYIPTAGIALGTVACIISANALNKRQQAMLISAYGYLDQQFRQYRRQVKTVYGEEAEKKVAKASAKDLMGSELATKSRTNEKCLFYDEISNRYFERTMLEVVEAELHLNRNYQLRGYCELNELYEFLGLEPTDYGATVGWSMDVGFDFYGYSWIDFEHDLITLPDGIECFLLDMPFMPTADFLDGY